MNTVLHKNDEQFAIVTTASTEEEFRAQFSAAFEELIDSGAYDGDWRFQLEGWMAPATEIICKLRGYKSQVIERRTIIAGVIDPDVAVIEIGHKELADLAETPQVAAAA